MNSQKITSNKNCARLYPVGVRKRKSGKFGAEIRHPIEKKNIWLGTFTTVDEASARYKSKKLEFEELMIAKNAKKDQISEKSDKTTCSSDGSKQKSSMVVTVNSNPSKGVEEKIKEEFGNEMDEELFEGTWVKISEGNEVKISHKLGVPIVDNYGYLVGEFSAMDDLSIDK
ncbi:ethylene-responsive transcription factor ERF119-like [Solanum stenotomum]|uniref:ethylene-responsive transcription factor ERF119-like n=1 Tax=Solanum stenotomum TaxID=172797 RepID=UPI0020D0BC70|nr:ethylene-responsive transcription factor ERF119-like [Solanum stenotomum]